MRFGLVGTHFWARETHAAALAAADGAEFVGVWGRDPAKASALAEHTGTRAFPSFEAVLEGVDAVAFAVPPDVQAPLAERAARAGKHLLLEKPIALDPAAAAALAAAVEEAGVAAAVFFTRHYTPEGRAFLDALAGSTWEGGSAVWLANAFTDGSPFATPWRAEHGGLWDVGPHAVAVLATALGPVTGVHAVGGVRDLVHLVLTHDGGATSTAAVSLTAPPSALHQSVEVWGEPGRRELTGRDTPSHVAATTAVTELVAAAQGGTPSPYARDVRFGLANVEVLAEAQRQLDAARG